MRAQQVIPCINARIAISESIQQEDVQIAMRHVQYVGQKWKSAKTIPL